MALLLSQWDSTGLLVEAAALIEASGPGTLNGTLYADSDRGGTDSPIDGELGLGTGQTVVSRIRRPLATHILFNDNNNPVALTLSSYFGSAGPGIDLTLYLVDEDLDVVSIVVSGNVGGVGGGFVNLALSNAAGALLDGIATGDRFIIAFARPDPDYVGPVRARASGRHDTRGSARGAAFATINARASGRHDIRGSARGLAVTTSDARVSSRHDTRGSLRGAARQGVFARVSSRHDTRGSVRGRVANVFARPSGRHDTRGSVRGVAVATAHARLSSRHLSRGTVSTRVKIDAFVIRIGGRIYVGSESHDSEIQYNSLNINRVLNSRATMSVRLKLAVADIAARMPIDGEEITVDFGSRREFGGYVDDPEIEYIPGGLRAHATVNAVSYGARLEELRVEGFIRTTEGQSVGDVVRTLMTNHAAGEGFTTNQVEASDIVIGGVFDYITLADALNRLARQANCIWYIDSYKDLVFRNRDNLVISPVTLDSLINISKIKRIIDRQHYRSVQTVIGGPTEASQRREEFAGDGAKREFPLSYRADKIIEVSVNGATQSVGDGQAWKIDVARSVLIQNSNQVILVSADELSVLYNYKFPIVITRSNQQAINNHRRVHRVHQDAAIDSIEAAEELAEKLLDRHDSPTLKLKLTTVTDTNLPTREGDGTYISAPTAVTEVAGTIWLVDRLRIYDKNGLPKHDLTVLANDHESLYEDFWDERNRITVPTDLTLTQSAAVDTAGNPLVPIDPTILGLEGLRIPASLGGRDTGSIRSTDWQDIPGFSIARLDGRRLNLINWRAMIQCAGTVSRGSVTQNLKGQLRLRNTTLDTVRGAAVTVTSTDADLVLIKRITLSPNVNDYRLQGRVIPIPAPTNADGSAVLNPPAFKIPRRSGLKVWAAEIHGEE